MQRFTSFDTITRLAATRTYPLQSSFRPSYNMAVNLVRNYDHAEAQHLVNSSFAEFQQIATSSSWSRRGSAWRHTGVVPDQDAV